MNARVTTTAAAGLLVLGALALAGLKIRSVRDDQRFLAAALKENTRLNEETCRKEAQVVALNEERAALELSLDQLRAGKAAEIAAKVKQIEAIVATPWREVVLQKDPRLQALQLNSKRANMAQSYGAFWRSLGLSPDQIERFQGILMDHDARMMDLDAAAQLHGPGKSDPAVDALRRETDDALRSAQLQLLGETGYDQLREYQRTLPVRTTVDGLAGSLAVTDLPLSAQQAEQLVTIIANSSSTYRDGGTAEPATVDADAMWRGQREYQEAYDWAPILTQAGEVLSASQVAVLAAQVAREHTLVQVYNFMQKSTDEAVIGYVFGRQTVTPVTK